MIKKVVRKIRRKKGHIDAVKLKKETLYTVRVIKPKQDSCKINDSYCLVKYTFPERMIITNAIRYDDFRVYIFFYMSDKNIVNQAYVPNDFQLEVIEDNVLMKSYEDYIIKNLPAQLGHSLTLGSDPEMFVEDENEKVIPAFNFLGSKDKPNRTYDSQDFKYGNNKMYWDGFQAEFETAALTCLGWHTDSVFCGIKGLFDKAKKYNPKAKLSLKTTMDIDYDLLKTSAEEHVQFGCMPSFNAYGMQGLQFNGRDVPFRSAGGHIHYGIGKITHEQAIPIVKALDAILGVACVSLFAKYDDVRRRQMYGLAGEYRLPPHGLEYRVLSNAWMAHPAIMNLVFDVSRKVLMFGKIGLLKYWDHKEEQTIEIINTCNVDQARATINRNKELFKKILEAAYGLNSFKAIHGVEAFLNGMECVIETPNDIEKNWLVRPGDLWITHMGSPGKSWDKAAAILATGKKVS